MEAREILIANTKTQKKYKITSSATTLGELKNELDAAGIDYVDMSFTEGVSNTQLIDDSSQLPTNIKYKGQTTNNLVILLTNTSKKIASGAEDRKTAYQVIKNNDLQEEVKEEFGRNFTLVCTSDLWDFIHRTLDEDEVDLSIDDEEEDDEDEETCYGCMDEEDEDVCDYDSLNLINALYDQIKTMVKMGVIDREDLDSLIERVSELAGRMKEESTTQVGDISITSDDLEEMISKA